MNGQVRCVLPLDRNATVDRWDDNPDCAFVQDLTIPQKTNREMKRNKTMVVNKEQEQKIIDAAVLLQKWASWRTPRRGDDGTNWYEAMGGGEEAFSRCRKDIRTALGILDKLPVSVPAVSYTEENR